MWGGKLDELVRQAKNLIDQKYYRFPRIEIRRVGQLGGRLDQISSQLDWFRSMRWSIGYNEL